MLSLFIVVNILVPTLKRYKETGKNNVNNIFYLTQHSQNIIQHTITVKLLRYILFHFCLTTSSKSSVYFIRASHLNLDQLHFKGSLASRGYHICQHRMERRSPLPTSLHGWLYLIQVSARRCLSWPHCLNEPPCIPNTLSPLFFRDLLLSDVLLVICLLTICLPIGYKSQEGKDLSVFFSAISPATTS